MKFFKDVQNAELLQKLQKYFFIKHFWGKCVFIFGYLRSSVIFNYKIV